MRRLAMALALASLTACDFAEKHDFARERESGRYQAAMADYKAGRIDQAVAGFRKTCREEPANASARFQLACLLQDSGRDYLQAYCCYQEFLMQCPESDRTSLAKNRALMCEREVAKILAEKHGLTNTKALSAELETVRRQLKDSEKRNAKLSDDVGVTMQRVAHLLDENAKLKAAIKGETASENAVASAGVRDAKALLDEDDSDRMKVPEEARKESRRLRDEREEADTDRIKHSSDIAALRQEADRDEDLSAPSLLPPHEKNAQPKALAPAKPAKPAEPLHEARPAVYVIQEGDTLYKIAMRFYGKSSAWKLVREANKAVISTDGRVLKGMKIRLPDPK